MTVPKSAEERLATTQIERITAADGQQPPLTITAPVDDNSNRIATTAFVHAVLQQLGATNYLAFASSGTELGDNAPQATGVSAMAFGPGARALLHGQVAFGVGCFANPGDVQVSRYQLRASTNNNIQTALSLDGESGSIPNRPLVVRNNSVMFLNAYVTGLATSVPNQAAAYHFEAAVRNIGGVIGFVGTPKTVNVFEDISSWHSELQLDPINKAVAVIVQGESAKLIRWAALVEAVEITY